MATFTDTKKVAEGDVALTLRNVLSEVRRQNEECIALVAFRVEKLGTPEARVVLTFDDEACAHTSPPET